MEKFGLHWDGDILYQTRNRDAYITALERLKKENLLYACTCTRKFLKNYRAKHPETSEYPGICRNRPSQFGKPHSLRIRTDDIPVSFIDGLQGKLKYNLAKDQGDFIIKRRDQIIAYQLSVVVDDHDQKITEVVRGFDLLDSTPKQIFLQKKLTYSTPDYMHVPIIINKQGAKLSKQTYAEPVNTTKAHKLIHDLLIMLKQSPPDELQNAPIEEQLSWAVNHWNPAPLKKFRAISL